MIDFQDLLVKTSRTFALSIPYLPEPIRQQVTLAYLIFRIAETFEDAASWPQEQRIQALNDFGRLLGYPQPDEARRLARHWPRAKRSRSSANTTICWSATSSSATAKQHSA